VKLIVKLTSELGGEYGKGSFLHVNLSARKSKKKKRPENFSGLSDRLHTAGVAGSNPASPTIIPNKKPDRATHHRVGFF